MPEPARRANPTKGRRGAYRCGGCHPTTSVADRVERARLKIVKLITRLKGSLRSVLVSSFPQIERALLVGPHSPKHFNRVDEVKRERWRGEGKESRAVQARGF